MGHCGYDCVLCCLVFKLSGKKWAERTCAKRSLEGLLNNLRLNFIQTVL